MKLPFLSKLISLWRSKVVKNSFYNLSGQIFQTVTLFITTPLLVKWMGVEDYGLWMVVNSVVGTMGILELGMGASATKFIAEYSFNKNRRGLSSVVIVSLCVYSIVGILLMLIIYFSAPIISSLLITSKTISHSAANCIQVAAFGFLPTFLINIGVAMPMGLQRYEISNIIYSLRVLMSQLTSVIIVIMGGHVLDVLIGNVFVLWIFAFIALFVTYRILLPHGLHFYISWDYAKKIFSFSGYVLLQNLGSQLFSYCDRIVIGRVLGLQAVTYYSVGTMVTSKMIQVVGGISQSLLPAASEAMAVKNYSRLYSLFLKGTLSAILISFTMGGILLIFSKLFLQFWMGTEFMRQSLSMFRILILAYVFISINAPAFFIANGIGIPWINSITSIVGGILTILLIILFGNLWELNGVALANFGFLFNYGITIYLFINIRKGLLRNSVLAL